MKNYEAMFILKPDLDKTGVDKILGQAQELVAKQKGAIVEIKDMGKSRLAYPLKKHKEGLYYRMNFSIIPDAISAIKKNLTLNESVLRILIVKT